jgi:hypothetical protein
MRRPLDAAARSIVRRRAVIQPSRPSPARRAPRATTPRRCRRGSLRELNADVAERSELGRGLDSLGDHARADLRRERRDGRDDRVTYLVRVDVPDQRDVELHEVRREQDDVPQAREPRAGVVDRETESAATQGAQRFVECGVIVDRGVLGHLEHQSFERKLWELVADPS